MRLMVVIYKRSVGITVWFLMWQELGVNNDPAQTLADVLAQFQRLFERANETGEASCGYRRKRYNEARQG